MVARLNSRMLPLFLLLLVAVAGCSETQRKETPLSPAKPVYDRTDIDLGIVYIEDGEKVLEYHVRNEGDKYFWIIDANSGCECTRAEFSTQEVKKGESTTIKVFLNPAKIDPGSFERDLNVFTNLSNDPQTLYIHGVAKHKK